MEMSMKQTRRHGYWVLLSLLIIGILFSIASQARPQSHFFNAIQKRIEQRIRAEKGKQSFVCYTELICGVALVPEFYSGVGSNRPGLKMTAPHPGPMNWCRNQGSQNRGAEPGGLSPGSLGRDDVIHRSGGPTQSPGKDVVLCRSGYSAHRCVPALWITSSERASQSGNDSQGLDRQGPWNRSHAQYRCGGENEHFRIHNWRRNAKCHDRGQGDTRGKHSRNDRNHAT